MYVFGNTKYNRFPRTLFIVTRNGAADFGNPVSIILLLNWKICLYFMWFIDERQLSWALLCCCPLYMCIWKSPPVQKGKKKKKLLNREMRRGFPSEKYSTFRDHQNRRPVGPGPTEIHSGRQNFGPCRPDGPIQIWPNLNCVLLFIYTFSGSRIDLSKSVLAKKLKGLEKGLHLCRHPFALPSFAMPSLSHPPSFLTMYKCQPSIRSNIV